MKKFLFLTASLLMILPVAGFAWTYEVINDSNKNVYRACGTVGGRKYAIKSGSSTTFECSSRVQIYNSRRKKIAVGWCDGKDTGNQAQIVVSGEDDDLAVSLDCGDSASGN